LLGGADRCSSGSGAYLTLGVFGAALLI